MQIEKTRTKEPLGGFPILVAVLAFLLKAWMKKLIED